MDFILKSEAVFYAGAIIIIFGIIWFIYDEIKEDEGVYTEILWKEHKGVIIITLIFLILGIFIWRELYLFIINHIDFFKKQNIQTLKTIQSAING